MSFFIRNLVATLVPFWKARRTCNSWTRRCALAAAKAADTTKAAAANAEGVPVLDEKAAAVDAFKAQARASCQQLSTLARAGVKCHATQG